MRSFEIEDIFVKHFLNSDFYFGHIGNIGSIYKIEPLLHFTNKVLFAPTSYAKMFGLIQFLPLPYYMLLLQKTPFKIKCVLNLAFWKLSTSSYVYI